MENITRNIHFELPAALLYKISALFIQLQIMNSAKPKAISEKGTIKILNFDRINQLRIAINNSKKASFVWTSYYYDGISWSNSRTCMATFPI